MNALLACNTALPGGGILDTQLGDIDDRGAARNREHDFRCECRLPVRAATVYAKLHPRTHVNDLERLWHARAGGISGKS